MAGIAIYSTPKKAKSRAPSVGARHILSQRGQGPDACASGPRSLEVLAGEYRGRQLPEVLDHAAEAGVEGVPEGLIADLIRARELLVAREVPDAEQAVRPVGVVAEVLDPAAVAEPVPEGVLHAGERSVAERLAAAQLDEQLEPRAGHVDDLVRDRHLIGHVVLSLGNRNHNILTEFMLMSTCLKNAKTALRR